MLNRPLTAVTTRVLVVATVLLTGLMLHSLPDSAFAQEHDESPCTVVDENRVTCNYEENGDDAVADFSGMDPEGEDVIWTTGGTDRSLFTAEGGELKFKDSPDYEDPKDSAHTADGDDDDSDPDIPGDMNDDATNNVYVVKVRATEDAPDDQEEPAKYTEIQVRVTVTNKNEEGEIDIVVRQPQVDQELTATASDPDTRNANGSANANGISGTPAIVWQWSVPKVSRPVTENNDHWTPAAGTSNVAAYTPLAGDVGSILRAQAIYTDGTGEERTVNVLTEFAVRAEPTDNDGPNAFDSTDNARSVDENSAMGTLVGPPVTTTDSNAGDVLYYTLGTSDDEGSFAIDKKTGQITVDGDVDHEAGGTDGVYTVNVIATDPSGESNNIDISVTAKDVNEKPTVAEDAGADKTTPEIDSTPPDPDTYTYVSGLDNLTYTKADVDDGDETTFSLAGDDAGQFDMEVSTSNADELTLSFKSDPNYDVPGDADKDNTYKVSVVATDKAGLTGMADVEIVVEDVPEDGTVTVSPGQPAIGRPVTATLSEPDTEVSDLKWQWQSSQTGADDSFANIEGADSDTYTPKAAVPDDEATVDVNEAVDSDEGMFLRAVATYIDKAAPLTSATDDEEDAQVAQMATGDSDHAVRAAPDENDPPAFEGAPIEREVREDTKKDGDVGDAVEATDPNGDDLTYEITGGADMDKFTNDGAQIKVGSAEFDYDDPSAQQAFEVELTATDPFGLSGSTMVTITVTDFNEAPDFEVEDDPEDYEENGDGAVATFMGADPEGEDVIWTTGGTDGSLFTAEGGELKFKDSPDYEDPKDSAHTADGDDDDSDPDIPGDMNDDATNNVYVVKVRATEDAPDDQEEPAKYTEIQVRVTVTNKNEEGEIDIVVRQPQVDQELTATASDPDTRNANGSANANGISGTPAIVWQWSVPKVSRPVTENNDHWTPAAGTSNVAAYTPLAGDVGSILRAQAIYTDGTGEERTVNVLTEFAVRAEPTDNDGPNAFDSTDNARSVDENSAMGTLVGPPVTTTDSNAGDVLYYTLGTSDDEGSFAIDKKTGQITVDGDVDHEAGGTDGVYTVNVIATDPSGESNNIDISVTAKDVNEKPTVAEDAGADKTTPEIDSTPPDPDTYTYVSGLDNLTYTKADVDDGDETTFSLAGDDAGQFDMEVSTSNADELTLSFKSDPNYDVPGDADKDNTYKVSVVATDKAGLTGMADVEIVVEDVPEDGTVTVSPGQPAIGRPVTATLSEPDTEVSDLKWQWQSSQTGADDSFTNIEGADSDTYTPKAAVPDDEATVDVNEAVDSDEGIFLRAEATYIDAAAPLTSATDDEEDAQVAQMATGDSDHAVRAAPDENDPPAFEGAPIEREVREDTKKDGDVGDAVEATDPNGDDLTYEITGGADMDKFTNDGAQIKVGSAEFDYDDPSAQQAFEVELTATDPFGLSGSTMVTITVTDFNEAPTLGLRPPNSAPEFESDTMMRAVDENTEAGGYVGDPVTAMDIDEDDALSYSLSGGTDMDAFSIGLGTGQIMVGEGTMLDAESDKTEYEVEVTADDGNGEIDTVMVTITVTDVNEAPVFDEEAEEPVTREVPENTDAGEDIGAPVAATDPDEGDTLTYTLGGADMASFDIDAATGQLMTKEALDHETKDSYTVMVTATDGDGESDSMMVIIGVAITVTDVNEAPEFPDTETGARSVAENTDAGEDIGAPVAATDPDAGDTLTYTLGGDDAASFDFATSTGQLMTKEALDHETKDSYTVMVTATDGDGESETVTVAITVTDVNEAPEFPDTETGARSVAENTDAGEDIGAPVAATDPDEGDTLTYTLGGADMASFDIDAATGQLMTSAALDYETTTSYTVMVTATDGDGESETVTVAITVTDVNEAPEFPDTETGARSVAENTDAGEDIGAPVAATDPDEGDTLTYTLGGADMASFDIDAATGQLMTSAALDYETTTSYTVMVTATDGDGESETVTVAITVTDVNEAPEFPDTETGARSVAENTDAGEDIGAPVAATDPDVGDTLTYTLGGADMASFDIDAATGQLMTSAALDYETTTSYTVMVTATDGDGESETVTVAITVTDVNEAPEFPDTETGARSVAENTAAGEDIGAPVAATDPDAGDTLTYTLGGDDAGSFAIDAATGQLMTEAALDYETKASYSVEVTADDGNGESDTVMVTITVTNVGLDNAYDADDDGAIDVEEALDAVDDYFDGNLDLEGALDVIDLYFDSQATS